ncbi:MAG: hypothetical protein JWN36_2625 [Microbacteriaceae bacterium]|nr:hypothetical protein [Microbacteriaceae bacterium]
MSKTTDEPIDDFDETNGLAPGLDGDADDPKHYEDNSGENLISEIGDELVNGFRPDESDEPSRE